jgi:hypothetical protein
VFPKLYKCGSFIDFMGEMRFHPFAGAKPRLSRRGGKARLRVNPEQALASMAGSRRVDLREPLPYAGKLGSKTFKGAAIKFFQRTQLSLQCFLCNYRVKYD